MHSSGIFSFDERLLKYPNWRVHFGTLRGDLSIVSFLENAIACSLSVFFFSMLFFSSIVAELLSTVISVKQKGHAA